MSNGNGWQKLPAGFGVGVPILVAGKVYRCKVGHEYRGLDGMRVRVQVGVKQGGEFVGVGGIVNTSGYICPQCVMDFFSVNFKVEEQKEGGEIK